MNGNNLKSKPIDSNNSFLALALQSLPFTSFVTINKAANFSVSLLVAFNMAAHFLMVSAVSVSPSVFAISLSKI
uniref:Uncharacterized protein n=1 Tax=Glossina pallidipes TaxID=7398 RepID=A0A1A9ZE84_GLOPL